MAKLHTLTDTFDTQDTAKWSGYGTGVAATGGVLELIPDSTFGRALNSAVTYDLAGSYGFWQVPTVGSAQILSFALYVDGSNRLEIFDNFGALTFRETVATVTNDTTVTYNATTHRWWRITESGGTAFWDTSPDGFTWTNQRSKAWAVPAITAVTAQIMAYTTSGTTPAQVDNFNLPPTLSNTGQFFGMF